MPPHLAVSYRLAEYRVAGLSLRIGRHDRGLNNVLTGLGLREAILISAANPGSRLLPRAQNAKRHAALVARLGAGALLPAESGRGRWRETQIFTAGAMPRLRALGRRFGQMALVRLRPGQKPALVPLR